MPLSGLHCPCQQLQHQAGQRAGVGVLSGNLSERRLLEDWAHRGHSGTCPTTRGDRPGSHWYRSGPVIHTSQSGSIRGRVTAVKSLKRVVSDNPPKRGAEHLGSGCSRRKCPPRIEWPWKRCPSVRSLVHSSGQRQHIPLLSITPGLYATDQYLVSLRSLFKDWRERDAAMASCFIAAWNYGS